MRLGEKQSLPTFYTLGDITRRERVSSTAGAYWLAREWLVPDAVTVGGLKLFTEASYGALRRQRRARRLRDQTAS
jgi:hypothetical protein